MAKNREQKEKMLEKYRETLTQSDGYFAVDASSIDAHTITELKKKLKELGSNVIVVKNNIFKIALQDTDLPAETSDFSDETAVIPYSDDPTQPAKLIKEVQKETEVFTAKYGVIKGKYMDGTRVMQLADIPSREELLAKMLGSLNAPLAGFANVASGNARGFVQVLNQLSEKED